MKSDSGDAEDRNDEWEMSVAPSTCVEALFRAIGEVVRERKGPIRMALDLEGYRCGMDRVYLYRQDRARIGGLITRRMG